MKQLLYRLLFGCTALLLLAACEADNVPFENNTDASNCIILNLEASSVPVRATVEGNDKENAVDHIDVFVFKIDNTLFHYERLQLTAANGKAALTKKRSEFGKGEHYKVYIVANSNLDNFADVTNLNELKSKFQEDQDIHLTGLSNLEGVPQFFLMDGIATVAGKEAGTDNTVELNFGEKADNTELEVNLKRAAAKILVHMKKGPQVVFSDTPGQDGAVYYMRNLPYASTLLSGVATKDILRTSNPISTEYFAWKTDEITVTAYAYEHEWADASTLQKEPRLIVNIPLTYTSKGTTDPQKQNNSYYQISVSRDKKLERNTCYETTVIINAPGGSDPSDPLALDPISYTVSDWVEKTINVGGKTDRPAYLTLNEYAMEMHNMVEDNTTLEFASSSNVKAKITKVWYIDKFGQEKTLSQVRTNPNQWSESNGKNLCEITITPDDNITGNIHVHGTVPENNTIRYITFELTNEENITRTVTVAQYPLEYITNIQSWYSYRDDFKNKNSKPTTYEYKGDGIYGISYNNKNGTYTYHNQFYSWNGGDGFWRSKVASKHNSDGSSQIDYYYYNNYSSPQTTSAQKNGNARMYHVRITASSGDYTLGNPRITNGYTDPGPDNAQIVSPSFMIASRLGFVNTSEGGVGWSNDYALDVARTHCANYVEVYKDDNNQKVVLDDWRLPTTAELEIIMKFQGTAKQDADAIDFLLNANYYWSASKRVSNSKGNSPGTSIRCIRDAYDTKK